MSRKWTEFDGETKKFSLQRKTLNDGQEREGCLILGGSYRVSTLAVINNVFAADLLN